MPCCVLRVEGAEFDPDTFLATSDLVADTVYRRGESGRGNTVNVSSGFTALLSDVGDYARQVQDAVHYLCEHRETLARLRSHGVTLLLDFGCELPIGQLAGRYYRLPLSLLELGAQFGIEIELSVYATR